MALTHPSPNNVPPAPPEGMRWVWHAAAAEWALDAALPEVKLSRWERLRDKPLDDGVYPTGWGWLVGGLGMILAGPVMFIGALACIAALGGAVWFLGQFGIG
jgi:hypothetical protein